MAAPALNLDLSAIAVGQPELPDPIANALATIQTTINSLGNVHIAADAAISLSKIAFVADLPFVDMTAWTPTLESGAVDWNFASKDAFYQRIGRNILFTIALTDAVTPGSVTLAKISLPVSGKAGTLQDACGLAYFWDNSAGNELLCKAYIASGDESNLRLTFRNVDIKGSDVATGDYILIQGIYRVA